MNRILGKKPLSFLKATIAFAVALAFFTPLLPAVGVETFDDTTVCVIPYAQAVNKGETFNVSIRVEPGEMIMGIDVGRLSFDPALLHLNSVNEGDIFDPYDTFTPGIVNNTDGTVVGIGGSTFLSNATASPGDFCYISFTAQEKIGTSLIDLEDVVVTNISGVEIPVIVNDGEVAIGWSVTLDFNEYSGEDDDVVFGEALTANDGPPHDGCDIPKAPEPQLPYIRAWFDDGMPEPYDFLWEDYRQYPDTEKTWNLDAQWESNNSDPTDVTISWDINEFDDCEYASVILTRYNPFPWEDPVGWEFAADMLTENNYVYPPRYFNEEWLIDHFRINATDVMPPVISNVVLDASDPLDTEAPYGWENVTCNVVDDGAGVNQVKLIVTDPDENIIEYYPMANIPGTDTYYYNTTFTIAGCYRYHIWADDINSNADESYSEQFELPPNWDVNKDGVIRLGDFILVAGHYGEDGPSNGWIREDVNNDGKIRLGDFIVIAGYYGEEWARCS